MNNILKEDIQFFASRFALATELEGKTIAVTGSTGLLGACMVHCLLALKAQRGVNLHIVAIARNMEKAVRLFGEEREELSYYQYDFSSTEPFQPKRKVDYLFHFAAPTASKDFVEKPVETMNMVYMGMQNILNYAEQSKLESLVLASTLEVYGTITDDSPHSQRTNKVIWILWQPVVVTLWQSVQQKGYVITMLWRSK